jgi:glycosyltransferase involved in cell wall biosynthesis
MKRVLIFSLAYYPRFVGGAEVAIKEITDRLGSDIAFDMVTLRKHAESFERVGNVNVYRVGLPWKGERTASSKLFPLSKILFPYLAYRKALELHRTKPYDMVWGMMAAYAGLAAMLFKQKNKSVPFVLTLQEGDPIAYIKRHALPIYPWFKKIFTSANVIQVISNYLGDFGRSMGFKGPIEVIPNGVSYAQFANAAAVDVGKKSGEVWLVHTGRLVTKNALDIVIKALPLLPANIHFLSIGAGPDKQMLEALAAKLNVANRVHFHPYVLINELPGYLKACNIFIRPSRSEGMGNSFIEAFAAGLPVIATQEGGIADFLFDAKRNPEVPTTGWAVDVNSPEQIAAQVKEILGNPTATAKVIDNARTLALEKYDWDLIAKDMKEKVLAKMIQSRIKA